jgi:hypothetical protein
MVSHEPDDDEDWYDDDDELDDEEAAHCPECSEPIHIITDKCPACGYWLSDDDRRKLYQGELRPFWMRATAVFIILAFLVCLLAFGWSLF